MLTSTPLLLVLPVTVAAALVAICGARPAARLVRLAPHIVMVAALVAVIGCVADDLSLLTAAVVSERPVNSDLLAVAVAASGMRLSGAGWAGRRVARLRSGAR